jgi:hypothetical protein
MVEITSTAKTFGQVACLTERSSQRTDRRSSFLFFILRNTREPLFRLSGSKMFVFELGDGTFHVPERVESATDSRARPSRPSCLKHSRRPIWHGGNARSDARVIISPNFASAANNRLIRLRDSTDRRRRSLPEVNHHSPRRKVVELVSSAGQKQADTSMTAWQLDRSPSLAGDFCHRGINVDPLPGLRPVKVGGLT